MKYLIDRISEMKCSKGGKVKLYIFSLIASGILIGVILWLSVFRYMFKGTAGLFVLLGYSPLIILLSGIIYLYSHEF